jgi:hypothetical protein
MILLGIVKLIAPIMTGYEVPRAKPQRRKVC